MGTDRQFAGTVLKLVLSGLGADLAFHAAVVDAGDVDKRVRNRRLGTGSTGSVHDTQQTDTDARRTLRVRRLEVIDIRGYKLEAPRPRTHERNITSCLHNRLW